jgi:hypothetical protein
LNHRKAGWTQCQRCTLNSTPVRGETSVSKSDMSLLASV